MFFMKIVESKKYSPVWSEKFQVRSFDIGLNRKMRISSICGYFQEVAGRHATHLDVGYKFVQKEGMVWVLSKLHMDILKLPEWGQEFCLETWPLGNERIFYRREYRLSSGNDTLIAATSRWILLDLKSRKPRIIALNEDILKANEGKYILQMLPDGFPELTAAETGTHIVRYSDLDQNRHVNNARYVEWIFDILDLDLVEKKSPTFFTVEYKHEVKAGNTVILKSSKTSDQPLTYAVEGNLSDTGQICVKSKIVF
jgi:acyl-ACP thioesterase